MREDNSPADLSLMLNVNQTYAACHYDKYTRDTRLRYLEIDKLSSCFPIFPTS